MKKCIVLILLVFLFLVGHSQVKDNFVRDFALYDKLYIYLDKHRASYLEDTLGNRLKDDDYRAIGIAAWNLKTDSIISDKSLIGVYGCAFGTPTEKPWLYINYGQKNEFLELDKLKLRSIVRKVIRFFRRHPNDFTLLEQLNTIQNVMETIAENKYYEPWKM